MARSSLTRALAAIAFTACAGCGSSRSELTRPPGVGNGWTETSLTRALAAIAFTACAGCGGAWPEPTRPLAVGEGWTETPLDDVLARMACTSDDAAPGCRDLCRVQVRVDEPTGARREIEHRIAPHARVVLTVRSDGSASARAEVVLGDERLHAMLEIPAGQPAPDAAAALRALSRPGVETVPEGALVTRTYERGSDPSYTLTERGGPVRATRDEREELGAGLEQRARFRGEVRHDSRAWVHGQTRRSESVHVGRDGRRSTISTTEELDARARVVRWRRTFVADAARPPHDVEHEYEYDDAGVPVAVTMRDRDRSDRFELSPSSDRSWTVERDPYGRPSAYRMAAENGEHVFAIGRDSEGRVTSVEYRSAWGSTSSITFVRDPLGRLTRESSESTRGDDRSSSRVLTRTLDDQGRLVRAEVIARARDADAQSERVATTAGHYDYDDRCPADVQVPDELDLMPSLDEHLELAPF